MFSLFSCNTFILTGAVKMTTEMKSHPLIRFRSCEANWTGFFVILQTEIEFGFLRTSISPIIGLCLLYRSLVSAILNSWTLLQLFIQSLYTAICSMVHICMSLFSSLGTNLCIWSVQNIFHKWENVGQILQEETLWVSDLYSTSRGGNTPSHILYMYIYVLGGGGEF